MNLKDIISIVVVLAVLLLVGRVINLITTFLFIGGASFVVYKLLFDNNKKIK